MFDIFCPTHGTRVLLGSRSIERIENTDHGIRLHWRCSCGTRGILRFGARHHAEADIAA